jgi:hypothetical protein
MVVDCPDCAGEGFLEADRYSHRYGHFTTMRECERCKGRGLIEREETDMEPAELVEHLGELAEQWGIKAVDLGILPSEAFEKFLHLHIPGVAVRADRI